MRVVPLSCLLKKIKKRGKTSLSGVVCPLSGKMVSY
jgi:hypothetical protein